MLFLELAGGHRIQKSLPIPGQAAQIDVVEISRSSKTQKVFILFGEHAREFVHQLVVSCICRGRLISAESGLHFVKVLCGEVPSLASVAKEILEKSSFMLVVNANPVSRRRVEQVVPRIVHVEKRCVQGEYCRRVNEHGVDLNRNWDDHW